MQCTIRYPVIDSFVLIALILILVFASFYPAIAVPIPVTTSSDKPLSSPEKSNLPALYDFQMKVKNDDPEKLSGVYIPGVFAMPVVQQPEKDPAYVSISQNIITQFSMADQYGTLGLLAHNFLAGKEFFNLDTDQIVILVYGDSKLEFFRIKEIKEYQALSPESPYSSFVNINNSSKILSSTDLFMQTYAGKDKLVFQTCIENGDSKSWGRRFVIAKKMTGFENNH